MAVENESVEGIHIHCLPHFPCQLCIEGPNLYKVQHLHSHGICIIDNVNCKWLLGENISLFFPCATWVQITGCSLYQNDLALVVESPRQGDIITLAVVPCFNQNERKRRQKGTRPSSVLLNAKSLAHLPFKDNFHRSGS